MRLSTEVWVTALIRRAEISGAFAVVVHRGDPQGGAVLVKIYNPVDRTARLYAQALKGEGETVWMQPHPAAGEADLDAYVERQRRFDPDLWMVEIEDREGRHFLTEAVEKH